MFNKPISFQAKVVKYRSEYHESEELIQQLSTGRKDDQGTIKEYECKLDKLQDQLQAWKVNIYYSIFELLSNCLD